MNTLKQISLGLFAAVFLLAAGSCKKKETKAPDKPKGVVLCKVNGAAWQSGSASSTIKIGSYTYYKTAAKLSGDTFSFSGIRNEGDTSGIYFYSVPLKSGSVGFVTGTTSAYSGGIYLSFYDINSLVATLGKYNVTYELTITSKNAAAKTISGTFIINMSSGKGNVTVTEGEFIDLAYK